MKKVFLLCLLFAFSCQTTKLTSYEKPTLLDQNRFLIKEISTDETYGYTQNNPIRVGCTTSLEGVKNERRFLNALADPNGEAVEYRRKGSCCPFKTKSPTAITGEGMLDIYEVRAAHSNEVKTLYINMYDCGTLKAPVGFTVRNK